MKIQTPKHTVTLIPVALYFDTSRDGAGVVISRPGHSTYTLHAHAAVRFETAQGDAAIESLFRTALNLHAQVPNAENGWVKYKVTVSAEAPQGYDTRGQSIRAQTNQKIGILKTVARRYGLPWGGDIAPSTAKKALTGNGRADKDAMMWWAAKFFPALTVSEHHADAAGGAIAALDGRFVKRNCGGRTTQAYKAKAEDKAKGGRLF